MTITTRSERNTQVIVGGTPINVGPGSYSMMNEKRPLASFVGFSSSYNRDGPHSRTNCNTPGPGAYLVNSHEVLKKQQGESNVFRTKAPRFAPQAPGSSIYVASTIEDNPGPGSYTIVNQPTPPRHHVTETSSSKRLVAAPKHSPAIPCKSQANGYREEMDGSLHPRNASSNIYSGMGQDTVGPAFYSTENIKLTKQKCVPDFSKSISRKNMWIGKKSPHISIGDSIIPGPGQYNPESLIKQDHARPSPAFASKIPILHESVKVGNQNYTALGPGTYNTNTTEEKKKMNSSPTKKPPPSFGTTSLRSDPALIHPNPYMTTLWKHRVTPGPGSYKSVGENRPKLRKSFKEETIGFQATSDRDCLAKTKCSRKPGPGTYNITYGSAGGSQFNDKNSNGRAFGSNAPRTLWQHERTEDMDSIPGPGSYTMTSNVLQHKQPNHSVFKSKTSRFSNLVDNSPHHQCFGETVTDQQNNQLEGLEGLEGRFFASPTTSTSLEQQHPVQQPVLVETSFLSTSIRFGEDAIFGQKTITTPGPGAYIECSPNTPSQRYRGPKAPQTSLSTDSRFKLDMGSYLKSQQTSHELGPGTYTSRSSFVPKSFNVTMQPSPSFPSPKSKVDTTPCKIDSELKNIIHDNLKISQCNNTLRKTSSMTT